ncbi:MAG: response regulator transcription factor [Candidatus Izimaplasma sp.]|nr:response regulator transcription factor [Candidatus Izimaplasma bacterium]
MYQKILIIEDDIGIERLVRLSLQDHKFDVKSTTLGLEGLEYIKDNTYDLILLDLGLPDIDGVILIDKIREVSEIPIIIISARFKEDEKVEALEKGADDFLTKPFGVNELIARIKVVLKRYQTNIIERSLFKFDQLSVDLENRIVTVEGESSHLTPIEFNILKYLIQNHGKVCTHKMIHEKVWGYSANDGYQSLRVFIGNIRRKIHDDVVQPKYISTESGVGYRFVGEINE